MRYLKHILAILVLTLGTTVSLWAQNREVSGRVLDTGGQPLIGAAVLLAGTTSGDVTDVDGAFSLRVPASAVTLEVSCLGYVGKTVSVPAAQSQVTVVLEEDKMVLEETVVVGYGVQKKVNLTGGGHRREQGAAGPYGAQPEQYASGCRRRPEHLHLRG